MATLKQPKQETPKINVDDLKENDLVIVNDLKPQSADKTLKKVPFKVTVRTFKKLKLNNPSRYELVSKYSGTSQLQQVNELPESQKAKPEIVKDESGLQKETESSNDQKLAVSKDSNATDAIAAIEKLETEAAVNAFIVGEDRKTVLEAANLQLSLIKGQ